MSAFYQVKGAASLPLPGMRVFNLYLHPSHEWTTLYVPPGATLVSAEQGVTYWQHDDFDANSEDWTPFDKYLVRTGTALDVDLPGAQFVRPPGTGDLGGIGGYWLYRVGRTLARATANGTPEEPPMNSAYLPPETE